MLDSSMNHRNSFIKEDTVEEIIEEPIEVIEEPIDEAEEFMDMLLAMTKKEQINKLEGFDLTRKEIKALKYEADRVNKLFELMNQ